MKKATSLCLSILCLFFLTGCFGSETLDTSSGEAYTISLQAVYDALPESDKILFLDNFIIVVNGKVSKLDSQDRNIQTGTLGYISKLYATHATAGNFKNLNGKTSSDIITEGQAILRVALTNRLNESKIELQEAEKKVAEAEVLEATRDKITVEILSPLLGEERTAPYPKGQLGYFVVPIVIKNNSGFTVTGFDNDEIELFHVDNKESPLQSGFPLSHFVGDDGTKPLSSSGRGDVIAPGQEIKGSISVSNIVKEVIPYPLSKDYYAKFETEDTLTPKLDGPTGYISYDWTLQALTNRQEEVQMLNAELAKLP